MLVQFTVGNFKSFKDKVTLSLEATSDDWLEEDNVALVGDRRLVKAAAIYGPNAGGKSNFLAAMSRFRDLIQESSKESQQGEPIDVSPFRLHSTSESAPCFFEAIFLQGKNRYRYGFEVTSQAIQSEWLFRQADSIRETALFTREGNQIEVREGFKEGKGLVQHTRPNALFLSVTAQFNGEISGEILIWIQKFREISGLDDQNYMGFTSQKLNDAEYGPLIREWVKQADVGIVNLEREDIAPDETVRRIPKGLPESFRQFLLDRAAKGSFLVKTYHQHYDAHDQPTGLVEFNLKTDESAGTQKFVALTGPFLDTLKQGSVLFVDELEARLHPLLTKALVGLFNSSANRNNAQLIFATHDEGLLDPNRIRRDQVWFVEKNGFGSSRLYSLDEIKGVRKETKFSKEYLLGQFGAVPQLGNFQKVITP
jgi:AAA15 family ATPase/GTPase